MSRPSKPWYWADRGGWYVTIAGRRRCLAKGPKGKTRAAAEREFHLRMLAEGKAVETDRSRMTFNDLAGLFLVKVAGQVARGEREQGTYDSYAKYLLSATDTAGGVGAAAMRPVDLLAWVDGKAWGPTVRHDALNTVKIAYRWAKKVGHLAENPIAEMELPRPNRRTAIPTHEQVGRIFDAAWGQPFRDLLTALQETGCRPSEVATLTADRVDLGAGIWRVKNKTRTATGEATRKVYLTPAMIELTRRRMEGMMSPTGPVFTNSRGRPWTKGPISYRFVRLQRKLGYGAECTAYAFRRLWITDALERGINPAVVAELVGHKSLDMIMKHYNQLRQRTDHLREAVRIARPGSTGE
jgi:integrase/recombinase XerD